MEAVSEKTRNEEDKKNKVSEKSFELTRNLEERLEKSREKATNAVEEDSIKMELDVMIVDNALSNGVRTGDTDGITEATPVSGPS